MRVMNRLQVEARPQYNLDEMWREARMSARQTVGLGDLSKDVTEKFKRDMIASKHSPIREIRFRLNFNNIPTYTAQQYSRHRIATVYEDYFLIENVNPTDIEPYVRTQRSDRNNGVERGSQSAPVFMSFTTNVQGLIDMSHKRLCFLAEKPARSRWEVAKQLIGVHEPLVSMAMVPTCVACGFCPESAACPIRYDESGHFQRSIMKFRSIKNGSINACK